MRPPLAPLLLEGTNGLSPAAAGLVLVPDAVAVTVLFLLASTTLDGKPKEQVNE
jgi:hypothetical protein